jgi:hypothetical protein
MAEVGFEPQTPGVFVMDCFPAISIPHFTFCKLVATVSKYRAAWPGCTDPDAC